MLQCSFEDRIIKLAPGESGQLEIKVSNPDPVAVAVRAYLGDWERTIDGEQEFHSPGTMANSATEQIKLSESLLMLEPGEEGSLYLAVTAPLDQKGTRTAMVFLEGGQLPLAEKTEAQEMQIKLRITLRYGIKIYVLVEGTQEPGSQFFAFQLQPPGKDKIPVTVGVENTGNIQLNYRGQLEVRNYSGDVLEVVKLEPFSILPGGKLNVKSEISLPSAGEYLLLALLDYGDATMAAEAPFVVKGGAEK